MFYPCRTPTLIVAGGLDTKPGLGFGPACAPVELGAAATGIHVLFLFAFKILASYALRFYNAMAGPSLNNR